MPEFNHSITGLPTIEIRCSASLVKLLAPGLSRICDACKRALAGYWPNPSAFLLEYDVRRMHGFDAVLGKKALLWQRQRKALVPLFASSLGPSVLRAFQPLISICWAHLSLPDPHGHFGVRNQGDWLVAQEFLR